MKEENKKLPADWEVKKLGEVCNLQNGFAFKSSDYILSSNTMNFRMSQIRPGGGIDLENNPRFLPNEFATIYKEYLLKEGDIVIAMTDMASETKILGVPTVVPRDSRNLLLNQRVGKLFNLDISKVDYKYLKYILVSEQINKYYKSLGRGGLQVNISKSDILNVHIPLPPLPEQKRIVAILDEDFEAIAKAKENAEKNRANARELFDGYLNQIFANPGKDWEEKTLGDIARVESGGTPRVGVKEYWNGSIPWYSSGELNSLFTKKSQRNITKIAIDNSNAKIFPKGSLLIGMYDTAALKMSVIDRDAAFNQAVAGFEPNNIIDAFFVYYVINSKKPMLLLERRGVRQKNLSLRKIKEIVIPVPSIDIQREIILRISDFESKTNRLESIYDQKIADLDELKKSILQKAFAGEL